MTAGERHGVPGASAAGGDAALGGPATGRRLSSEAIADLVLTLALLGLFGWAFLEATEWSFRAALFPRIVTGVGVVFCVIKLVQWVIGVRRDRRPAEPAPHVPRPAGGTHEDETADEEDVEYVFATAGVRSWSVALGWVAAFFVLLYVAGLFVTAPVFSLLYLRFSGGQSWKVAISYAAVLGVVLYLAFEVALGIPTPPGLFLD